MYYNFSFLNLAPLVLQEKLVGFYRLGLERGVLDIENGDSYAFKKEENLGKVDNTFVSDTSISDIRYVCVISDFSGSFL